MIGDRRGRARLARIKVIREKFSRGPIRDKISPRNLSEKKSLGENEKTKGFIVDEFRFRFIPLRAQFLLSSELSYELLYRQSR